MTNPTAAYPPINHFHPVISNNKIPTENAARNNLINIRDFVITTGYFPGWDYTVSPYDTTNYLQPTSCKFVKGIEAIKIDFTWVSRNPELNGSGNNCVSKAAFYYSTDNQVTWQPLTDILGNYVATYTYDADDNCTAETWGTS